MDVAGAISEMAAGYLIFVVHSEDNLWYIVKTKGLNIGSDSYSGRFLFLLDPLRSNKFLILIR